MSNTTGRLLAVARTVVDELGLRRSRSGRRLIAAINVFGERVARRIYLRRKAPFMVDGHLMYLSGNSAPSLNFVSSILEDRYEPETKTIFNDYVKPGMRVLDIGAHVGLYTLIAARVVGSTGHVYAFEAERENYALLQKNVDLNGYSNVTCVPKAVSNRTGTLSLYVSHQGNDRHTTISTADHMAAVTEVDIPATSVDDFADVAGITSVDVIKMDVEGAEPMAIEGMMRLLGRSPAVTLIMEFAPGIIRAGGNDPAEFLHQLASIRFSIRVIEDGFTEECFETPSLRATMQEIERRGAVNLVCSKLASAEVQVGTPVSVSTERTHSEMFGEGTNA